MKEKKDLEVRLKEVAQILGTEYIKAVLIVNSGNVKIELIQCIPDEEIDEINESLPNPAKVEPKASYFG